MKNKCKLLFILIFASVLLFYKEDSVAAMENIQCGAEENIESIVSPEEEDNAGSAVLPEDNAEPAATPEEEQNAGSAVMPEEDSAGSAAIPEAEENAESAAVPEAEENAESAAIPEAEENAESAAIPEEEENTGSAAAPEGKQNAESDTMPESENIARAAVSEPIQSVSSGTALIEWLESHKNIGGMVKLTDNVVLNEDYCFCPDGMNKPAVIVDTGQYTITVTRVIELMSDHHLSFRGQPDGTSIFYVAEKGMLSMLGIVVESGQCALWQEEGAGLVIDNCYISGSVHYADMPFIVDQNDNSICAVVEKGQTLNDAIPTHIYCTVNRQGKVSHSEPVPVLWNLEGTEKLQEERRRFQIQGSFLYAASAEPALCTVAYNDYPLTFTDVEASAGNRWYSFRGGYTKPEKYLPITVMSEYSFDGESWIMCEKATVTNPATAFLIVLDSEQCDRAVHSNIYIRLHWDHNGTGYYSNVLCYATNSLEYVGEIGGSRGGGTSIINPPDDPQESNGAVDSKDAEQDKNTNRGSDLDNSRPEVSAGETQTESSNTGSATVNRGQSLNDGTSNVHIGALQYAETSNIKENQSLYAESSLLSTEQASSAQPKTDSDVINADGSDSKESADRSDLGVFAKENNAVEALHSGINRSNAIAMAAVLVLLSVISGIAGFYIHSRLGTNR